MNNKYPKIILSAILITGCGSNNKPPSQPSVTISPSTLTESDFQTQYSTFKFTAAASTVTDPDGDPITYSYQWFKNGTPIDGATDKELVASQMGRQGHTVRGYEFRCEVTASDNHDNKSAGETAITIGGPSLTVDSGVYYHNIFRVYGEDETKANNSLSAMKSHTNCNWCSIGITYFQDSIDATNIYEKVSSDKNIPSTIAEADFISQIKYAHSMGLKVVIYPEIWISGDSVGPRDQISGTSEWFAAYQEKLVHLADIAQSNNVELLCAGVELWHTQDKEQSWRQLIQAVRAVYSGPITYASQYYPGRVDAINWWDAVDYIGVTCLFEDQTGGTDMTVPDLVTVYSGYRDVINQVATKFSKPVIITETAAFSLDGCAKWGSSVTNYTTTQDLQEQADYFEASLETLGNQPGIIAFCVEDWFPTLETWYQNDPAWPTSTAFLNKPAERVIKSWYTQ